MQGGTQELVTLRMKVEGLKCEACSMRLKRHILSSENVESCDVNFESRIVTVKGRQISLQDTILSIESLGYSASTIPDWYSVYPDEYWLWPIAILDKSYWEGNLRARFCRVSSSGISKFWCIVCIKRQTDRRSLNKLPTLSFTPVLILCYFLHLGNQLALTYSGVNRKYTHIIAGRLWLPLVHLPLLIKLLRDWKHFAVHSFIVAWLNPSAKTVEEFVRVPSHRGTLKDHPPIIRSQTMSCFHQRCSMYARIAM